MAKVVFTIGEDTPSGVQLTKSTISVRPMRKRLNGEIVVTRAAQTYTLNQQAAVIELDQTNTGHAWIISIVPSNGDVIVGYYKIPFTDEVAFSKLVEVDPETMEPNAEPDPEWWAMAKSTVSSGEVVNGDLILESFDGETINAGRVQGEPGDKGDKGEPGEQGLQGVQGLPGNATMRLDTTVGTRVFISDGVTEKMVHGDTGWRSVGGVWTLPAWNASNGYMVLRRVDSTVFLEARLEYAGGALSRNQLSQIVNTPHRAGTHVARGQSMKSQKDYRTSGPQLRKQSV